MSQTRYNRVVTITNDETYDLAGHMARMADSINPVIRVANQAERDGLAALAPGGVLPIPTTVARADLLGALEVWDGTRWVTDQRTRRKFVPGTATGALAPADGWINIAAPYTVPANPFGTGVPYEIEVQAQSAPTNGTNGVTAMRALYNAATADGGQAQTPAGSSPTLFMTGSKYVADGSAQTVSVQISALTAAASLNGGNNIYWYRVIMRPTVNL